MAVTSANHPFVPGENHAKGHIGSDTDSRIKAAHAKTVGARLTDAAADYPNGLADGGVQPDGIGALQRAAKARLTGQYAGSKSPGTMSYSRNDTRGG